MQITELKEKYQDDTTILETIEIKQFIGFVEKKMLCIDILEKSLVSDDNGIMSIDFFNLKLLKDLKIIANYSNLEFSDDFIEEYDFLVENEILDYIVDGINYSDLNFIDEIIENELQQRIKIVNSIEAILASKIEKLISKIPDEKSLKKIMSDIPKAMNKIKPENLSIMKDLFNNKQGDSGGK